VLLLLLLLGLLLLGLLLLVHPKWYPQRRWLDPLRALPLLRAKGLGLGS
jgi:hypothetical protein